MAFFSNKRIIKNTVLLYARMILLMVVSLYTSRVILAVIGIADYGIYNLICGFITLFSFVSHSLITAIQRFYNVAIGSRNEGRLLRIYSMSNNMFVIFSIFLIVMGETVGLWFVKTQLNIPEGREMASICVYQASIVTLIVNLFRVPDSAAIIAYEKMGFYAYLSIGEAILKLGIVFLLQYIFIDKLILYVILYLCTTIIINIAYKIYCKKKFIYCKWKRLWDKELARELLRFSGWNVLSSGAFVMTSQGNSFFINRYYSVSVNAAQGIAAQVYNAVNTFITNFQTAFKPQLVKTYAAREMEDHYQLLYKSAKWSTLLMIIVGVPVIFNLDSLLNIWLVDVPVYTKEFCLFVLFAYFVDALVTPLSTTVSANGDIKGMHVWMSILYICQLVFCFFALRAQMVPYIVAISIFVVHVCFGMVYLYYSQKHCQVSIRNFIRYSAFPSVLALLVSLPVPYLLMGISQNPYMVLLVFLIDFIWATIVSVFLGLSRKERKQVKEMLFSRMHNNITPNEVEGLQ